MNRVERLKGTALINRVINKDWHQAHVLGQHASLDDRVTWHTQHVQVCNCHDMPESIKKEIARRATDSEPTRDSSA